MLNVIHHDIRYERKESFERQFKEQGIEYKVWDAVRGHNPMAKNISLAHKRIIQWAKENDLEEVMVAEDDILFHAPDAWQYFLNNKPESFDLYLGGIYRGEIKDNKTVDRFSGLHLYICHRRFYDIFLSVYENMDIDHALANTGDFHVCYPFAATQLEGVWSDNVQRVTYYDILLQNYKIYGK